MLKRGKALFASKCAVSTQNMVVRETAEIMPLLEDTGIYIYIYIICLCVFKVAVLGKGVGLKDDQQQT